MNDMMIQNNHTPVPLVSRPQCRPLSLSPMWVCWDSPRWLRCVRGPSGRRGSWRSACWPAGTGRRLCSARSPWSCSGPRSWSLPSCSRGSSGKWLCTDIIKGLQLSHRFPCYNLAAPAAIRLGLRRCERRKCPMWFTPSWASIPSSVNILRQFISPALLIRTSHLLSWAWNCLTNSLMDSWLAKSHFLNGLS